MDNSNRGADVLAAAEIKASPTPYQLACDICGAISTSHADDHECPVCLTDHNACCHHAAQHCCCSCAAENTA